MTKFSLNKMERYFLILALVQYMSTPKQRKMSKEMFKLLDKLIKKLENKK